MLPRIKIRSDKIELKTFNMTIDTIQRISQLGRNNKFKQIIIHTYRFKYAVVAETEDVIAEYCARKEAIKIVRSRRERRETNVV